MSWLWALLVPGLGFLLVAAEWIEMPQFSDQQKIYRTPTFHGLVPRPELTGIRNVTTFSRIHNANTSNNQGLFVEYIRPYTTETISSSTITVNDEESENNSDDIAIVSTEEEESMAQFDQPPIMDDLNEDISANIDSTNTATNPASINLLNASPTLGENNENKFFDYLPIDLLKQVHKTLKSQPSTLKGKIRFLKVFERTLLNEIESRLREALTSNVSRMPREARDHYEVDYHDDKIGFPSLEGTLMAISFLTFAVYLIRLVMMLFRNAGTIGIAPIIIGRKKRSIKDIDEETVRILSYLDSTSSPNY